METRLAKAHTYFDGDQHEALNAGYMFAFKDIIKYAVLMNMDPNFIKELRTTLSEL